MNVFIIHDGPEFTKVNLFFQMNEISINFKTNRIVLLNKIFVTSLLSKSMDKLRITSKI